MKKSGLCIIPFSLFFFFFCGEYYSYDEFLKKKKKVCFGWGGGRGSAVFFFFFWLLKSFFGKVWAEVYMGGKRLSGVEKKCSRGPGGGRGVFYSLSVTDFREPAGPHEGKLLCGGGGNLYKGDKTPPPRGCL